MNTKDALEKIDANINQIVKLQIECFTITEQATWNAAIEAAAIKADDGDCDIVAKQIRKLKK